MPFYLDPRHINLRRCARSSRNKMDSTPPPGRGLRRRPRRTSPAEPPQPPIPPTAAPPPPLRRPPPPWAVRPARNDAWGRPGEAPRPGPVSAFSRLRRTQRKYGRWSGFRSPDPYIGLRR
jgi:hypothetical protein